MYVGRFRCNLGASFSELLLINAEKRVFLYKIRVKQLKTIRVHAQIREALKLKPR